MYASVVKKEHMLKLKIFAPQTPVSIHSSHGMQTSVVKKCSLLKLSINSITGRKSTHVSISSIVSPDEINDYFCTINTDPNYIDPEILSIPGGTRIPEVTQVLRPFVTFCLI